MKIKSPTTLQREPEAEALIHRTRLAWTDFQTVLAVAQWRSVAKASVALAVSHVTLLRKLESIETRLNARLFERTRGRYTASTAGEELLAAATAMEPLARTAEMRVLGQDLRPEGHVRVTVASIVINHLLPPVLTQFAHAFPGVVIELAASRDHASLARREADVAIRVADQAPDWLVGRKLGQVQFAIYGLLRPGLNPKRRSTESLCQEPGWVSFEREARELKFDRWLDREVPDPLVSLRVDGFDHALTMVRAGLGKAVLPTFLEATCPELQQLSAPIDELETPLWLLTHQELRNTMRIKVLMRAFGPALSHALQAQRAN